MTPENENQQIEDYLNSIQVFPDKYFDELKWVVEAEK